MVESRAGSSVRLAELLAVLSLATDLGMGQPMEHVLRQCLIALRLASGLGLDEADREVVYYAALLAWVGCHVDAYEQAKWFGDDLALKADFRRVDFASAATGPLFMMRHLGAGRPLAERARLGVAFAGDGRRAAECDAGQSLARRRRPGRAAGPGPARPRQRRADLRALGRQGRPEGDRRARRSC